MKYRDLEGHEIIQPGDEVWNPHYQLWIPILAGAACVGNYADETDRQWRRVVEDDPLIQNGGAE